MVYTDASLRGLGGVLQQEERAIAFASRKLKPYERNYPTQDLELAAIVFTLRIWRHYLLEEKFHLFIDHKSLQYLFTQRELNMRQRRWLEFVKDYQFDIQYHPGKANVVADALSHRPVGDVADVWKAKWKELGHQDAVAHSFIYVMTVTPEIVMRVVQAQSKDSFCQEQIVRLLAEGAESYSVGSDGGLRFNGRLVVPEGEDLRHAVMTQSHGSKFTVHPGGDKMYQDMRRQYWWSGLKRDIAEFVSKCSTCQMVKVDHQRPSGLL